MRPRIDSPAGVSTIVRDQASTPRARSPDPAMPPRRAHVLTLVDHLGTAGGAERLALDIATRLAPSRFRSTLCASRLVDETRTDVAQALERMSATGVTFLQLGRRRRGEILPWRHLATYIRRERVEIIHAHMFGSNLWGTAIGRLARVPVIVAHEHTWSFEGQPLRRILDRELIARGSNAFIAVSRADRRKMIEIERIPSERIRFIPNGIDPRTPIPDRDLRAELGVGSGPFVGAVGALRAQKTYGVLIRAAALLREDHPDLRVLIAGDGPEKARLEALIGELGLGGIVLLLGRRPDVPDLLATLDVAVCASAFEGSPLSVMEYMEAGLPIVATRVGGVPDLIEDGVHGLLVEPGNPTGLAAAIDDLLSDRARAAALGAQARERRRREFALDVMVHNVEALYEELLAARGVDLIEAQPS
jgi:glycosyltransferase involved in cell wall biosynthesis